MIQAEPHDDASGDRWMWASVRMVKALARALIVDMTVYDLTTGTVGMSVEGFRCGVLNPQPPSVALYEAQWLKLKGSKTGLRELVLPLLYYQNPRRRGYFTTRGEQKVTRASSRLHR